MEICEPYISIKHIAHKTFILNKANIYSSKVKATGSYLRIKLINKIK